MIEVVSFDDVRACHFKPEPHTVSLSKYDPRETWYAYKIDGKIVSVMSVSEKHGGIYIGEMYTIPEYRRRGLNSLMIMNVCEMYPNRKKIAHCLNTSKKIMEGCGFVHYKTVYYKHGTQYYMKKEAENSGPKP